MSELSVELKWELEENKSISSDYNIDHTLKINNQMILNASSAPEYGGNENFLNPEQALAAAISSCHMMTFLALASKLKWPVIKYTDKAIAFLGKNSKGKMCVSKIELNPKIKFENNFDVAKEKMVEMQQRSHRYCFIANSLSEEVKIIIK